MKRFLWLVVALAGIGFIGCSKDIEEADIMSATIDGKNVSFSKYVQAHSYYHVGLYSDGLTYANLYEIQLEGYNSSPEIMPDDVWLRIKIFSDRPFVPGTYRDQAGRLPAVYIYHERKNGTYVCEGDGEVVIEALASGRIIGTFSGTLSRGTVNPQTEVLSSGSINSILSQHW